MLMSNAKYRRIGAACSIAASISLLVTVLLTGSQPYDDLPAGIVLGTDVSLTTSEPETEPSSSAIPPSSADSSSAPVKAAGKVLEVNLSRSGNLSAGNVRMTSKSATKIDLSQLLSDPVSLKLRDTLEPQVLIYHTHTTEAYMNAFTGTYPVGYDSRTKDTSRNVVGVGDVITERLNAAGIVTIHDTTIYDNPAYSGAYGRSQKTVEEYLKKYPSIKVILDVHRDAIQQNDGSLLKPTVEINGRKAAQIMLVSGCDDNGTLGFPNWRKNLTFAAHLQQQLVNDHPGLARPIYCWNVRYNAHLSPTALLVEMGADANTSEEVLYSAELFADSLITMLNTYIKQNG